MFGQLVGVRLGLVNVFSLAGVACVGVMVVDMHQFGRGLHGGSKSVSSAFQLPPSR